MDPIAALRERVDLIEEDFRQFRETFKPGRYALWHGLVLTASEWIIVDVLSDGHVWEWQRLLTRLESLRPSNNGHSHETLKVYIHRIQAKFRSVTPPLVINKVWGVGYQLSPESVPLLAARRIA